MTVSNLIDDDEQLGRGMFSSRSARRCRNNRVPKNVFMEQVGVAEISVDRLSLAPLAEAERISVEIAAGRGQGRKFYGWAAIGVRRARASERKVEASPIPANPFHADIILPDRAMEDEEEQIRHAQELADNSSWRKAPGC